MAYSNTPVRTLKPAEIERVKATCKEVRGFPDYWVDEHGKNLYFILSRDINLNGKPIPSRKVAIGQVKGRQIAELNQYIGRGWRLEDYDSPLDNSLVCAIESISVHMSVIVALAWIGPKTNPKDHARHLDGNPRNNHYKNIAWGSALENGLDKRWHNKVGRGMPESVRPECRDLPHRSSAANATETAS